MILSLTESDVSSVLDMVDGIRVVEESLAQHARGEATLVPRISQTVPNGGGMFRIMPAMLPVEGFFGLKTLTGFPGRRLPGETYFTILLFEAVTGALRALIAGTHLTGIRTGAATGVATKYLARQDADVLGIFGAGAQAKYQVAATMAVRPLRLVKVFSRDFRKAVAFAQWINDEFDVEAIPTESAQEVVQGSSMVVTVTTATAPVFSGEWLASGTHVSGVGANTTKKCELDPVTFGKSRIIVDSREQTLEESGDIQAAIRSGDITAKDVDTELGEVVIQKSAGRENNDEITLFKSVGVAVQDIAAAVYVYKQALGKGIGTALDLNANYDTGVRVPILST
jgi:ornithine cyclodeaminase/alanine dehydrogenase-like protein (mu-crystallin family)